ncbi:MAG: hypothetical protein U0800_22710 [Isosphaeraceae bacterium]
MHESNTRRRAEHRRKVLAALRDILNDPAVMPNEDCPDLVVNVSHVEFGSTVRDIYVDYVGFWRRSPEPGEESRHDRYMRQAKERGEDTYVDLTEVGHFAEWRQVVESELQKRLGLLYTPRLHVVRFLGRGEGGAWHGA